MDGISPIGHGYTAPMGQSGHSSPTAQQFEALKTKFERHPTKDLANDLIHFMQTHHNELATLAEQGKHGGHHHGSGFTHSYGEALSALQAWVKHPHDDAAVNKLLDKLDHSLRHR